MARRKNAAVQGQQAQPATQATAVPAPSTTPPKKADAAPSAPLSYADRENPGKLSGDALRKLAHSRGMARSDLASMSDDKIRMQLRYITARRGEEEMA